MAKHNPVVVSFSIEPRSLDKPQIAEQIEKLRLKGNMMQVAQSLSKSFPTCLVHTISHFKEVVEANSFKPECYYFGKHKKAYVCVHPE